MRARGSPIEAPTVGFRDIVYTNYLANSLNIYTSKTSVLNSSTLSGHLFRNKRLYYNSGLSLNKSINLTNISL